VTARRVTYGLVGLLVLYLALVGWRGLELIADGRPAFVLRGVGVVLLPIVGAVIVWREVRFGLDTQRLGRALEFEGGLPTDELPRRPSGRVDLAAADELFARRKTEAEAAPEDWRAWYRLAMAYGDAKDTSRGRRAMRHAIELFDAKPDAKPERS